MSKHPYGRTAMVAGAAVLVAGLAGLTPAAGASPAPAPGAKQLGPELAHALSVPAVDPTWVLAPGRGVSALQAVADTQITRAEAALGSTLRQAHAGVAETLTHPGADGAAASPAGPVRTAAPRAGEPGLDVSGYQGNVNWSQTVNAGAKFAYVKATEGTYYTNPYFSQQYERSYARGLVRGAYHFAIPNNSTGAAQADFFVAHGGGWTADGQTLPGVVDLEANPYGAACYGLGKNQMINWVNAFVNEYHRLTGRWAVIYTSTSWWEACAGNALHFASVDPLWVANYNGSANPLPGGWTFYTFWQFAASGRFPGDQDTFNGSIADLVNLARGT